MKCIEARAVQWPVVWKFYGSRTLLHFPTGGANDAQNVSVDTARVKNNDQQNLFNKNDNVIFARYITRSLQMSEDTVILCISS